MGRVPEWLMNPWDQLTLITPIIFFTEEPIRLDPERRATFASNLMTVIVSEQPASPVINVGTLTR